MKAAAEKKNGLNGNCFVFLFRIMPVLSCPHFLGAQPRKIGKKKTMFASLGFSSAKAFSSPRCNGSPYFFCGFDPAPRGADRFPDTAVLHLV